MSATLTDSCCEIIELIKEGDENILAAIVGLLFVVGATIKGIGIDTGITTISGIGIGLMVVCFLLFLGITN